MDDGTTHHHNPDAVAAHFDTTGAEKYASASHRIGWDGVVQQLVNHVKHLISTQTGEIKIADLGTGPGALTAQFLRKALGNEIQIDGLDISRESLKNALKENHIQNGIPHPITEVSKHVGGLTDYDAVTVSGVMDFVTPDQLENTVKEIAAMLKRGGIMAMTIEPPTTTNPGVNANQHDPQELETLLNAHGITNVTISPTSYKAWGPAVKRGQSEIETYIVTGIKTGDGPTPL